MRFRNLGKWDDPENSSGLVFFAQMLEEMLFDFSLDTYKSSVMHTGTLCYEAVQTIEEIELGNIKSPNLGHVCLELCSSFEKDSVAQALSPLSTEAIFPSLKNPKASLKDIRTVLELLSFHLSSIKYRKKNEELLREQIVGPQTISEIRRLTRSYITTLISIGFDSKHIHSLALEFFYFGPNRISGPQCIDDFFNLFPIEKQKFDVVYRVDKIFEIIAESTDPLGIQISKKFPDGFDPLASKWLYAKGETVLFAIALNRPAYDLRSASISVENSLKLCATLLTLFHHKETPSWRPKCVVRTVATNDCTKVSPQINSMHKCADLLPSAASNRLKQLINDFSLEKNSFAKFTRSAQLHSMALSSNADENQILNLWIALESLIPSESKSDDVSNIEHIVDSLIPFLNIGYIDNLTNNLVKDLLRWNGAATRKALRTAGGRKFTDKLVRLLVLPELATELAALEQLFGTFHLLRDRVQHFKSILATPASVTAVLDAHCIRLKWQIRRIYRTRNIIVHSGKTPNYTQSLIEHTHDFLDIVLSSLVKLASNPKSVRSVSQGFKYVELMYAAYYKSLSRKGQLFDSTNINELIFSKYI